MPQCSTPQPDLPGVPHRNALQVSAVTWTNRCVEAELPPAEPPAIPTMFWENTITTCTVSKLVTVCPCHGVPQGASVCMLNLHGPALLYIACLQRLPTGLGVPRSNALQIVSVGVVTPPLWLGSHAVQVSLVLPRFLLLKLVPAGSQMRSCSL